MSETFVRFKEGIKTLGISRATAYRKLKTDPRFPKLVKPLGAGTKPSAFVGTELEAYKTARIAEREDKAA